MKVFRYFARTYPGLTTLMMACMVAGALLDGAGISTLFALLDAQEIDGASAQGAEPGQPHAIRAAVDSALLALGIEPTVTALLITIVAVFWLKGLLMLISRRQVGLILVRASMDLRLRLLDALMIARWRFFVHQRTGSISAAFSSETDRVAAAYMRFTRLIVLLVQASVYSAFAFAASWQTATISFAVAGGVLFLLRRLSQVTRGIGASQTGAMRSLLARVSDSLQGLKGLKAMARQDRIKPLLQADIVELKRLGSRQVWAVELLASVQEPLVISCLALGAGICLSLFGMPFSIVAGLGIALARVLTSLSRAQRTYQTYTLHEGAFTALMGTIAEAEAAREQWRGGARPTLGQGIQLRQVALDYDGQSVLTDVDMEIPAGHITALIGRSGAGKTTIVDLIAGLVEPDRGEIRVDGKPLAELDMLGWREGIGYVPQEIFLLNDSILQNVSLGEQDVSRGQVERALRRAGAWEFVESLPDGMDSSVGERGARLSGGQRQRIAIARALLHDPQLLVLDEVTTSLDPATEAALWESLVALEGQLTIVAISHQKALASVASRIYRVEDGRAYAASS